METTEEKFRIIQELTSRDDNLLNITWLCEIAQVSRSGYYNWLSNKEHREAKEKKDKKDFEFILEAYNCRGYAKGARSIYMRLLHRGTRMNIKKIRRLMKKFNLYCPIRKANPYRRMAKALKTDAIILTDITYLFYNKKEKAYLSTMKDAFTNEILSYVVSESLEVDFVLETIEQLIQKHGKSLTTSTIIHSDQGCHYTSISFRKLLQDKELRQSMSRKGNCLDNFPMENFFGKMKNEMFYGKEYTFKTLEELKVAMEKYIDYYNNHRIIIKLKGLTPVQYRNQSLSTT